MLSLLAPLSVRRALPYIIVNLLTVAIPGLPAMAQSPALAQPRDRITRFIDDDRRITLHGNRHPLATPRSDTGAVDPEYRMDRMVLTLQSDATQVEALAQLLDAQHDPESPYYHQWMTPEEFGQNFGVSEGDAKQVAEWLQSHGFEVDEVPAGNLSIIFSGTAAQVEAAFHTPIHSYNTVLGIHHANAADPQIPASLASVVAGVVSLHDFRSASQSTGKRIPLPEFTSGSSYYLAPADFAAIYNLAPLYQQSITGSGQSVAVVARSNINLPDVRQFRTSFALPANDPQIVVNGTDPGVLSAGEETEAILDAEWSGAVAKSATVKFVVSKSTNASDGVNLSAQYIVNHNLAPVMTTSFGLCEAALGSAGNNFFNSLWQQAAAEGITVFVSSGDSGAAGCDSASATRATHGFGVNGICSTPYSVCVGGSQFADTANPTLYWSRTNAAGTESSALSYIPEVAWNESGPSSGLWSSGGGASSLYAKPAWQTGTGVPADNKRDVPDVSLTSASHDGYLIYLNGGLYVVGGTSAAAPSFAGLMTLVVQNAAARQGNANTAFYSLANKQRAGGAAVFHDVTSGNNSVPGLNGFTAGTGFDPVTGLGSVNANLLVSHWSDATATPAFHATSSLSSLPVKTGANGSLALSVTVSGGFNAAVTFSITGLPTGATASFTPGTLAAPGSGSGTLKITAIANVKPGAYATTIAATSGTTRQQIPLTLIITH
jgi:subtilase family serine protease